MLRVGTAYSVELEVTVEACQVSCCGDQLFAQRRVRVEEESSRHVQSHIFAIMQLVESVKN